MTEPTPEAAYRSYWTSSGLWALFYIPLAGYSAYLHSQRLPDGLAITAWSVGGTLAFCLAVMLVYAIPADRFLRRTERQNPGAIVFAATRSKSWDTAISELTEDRFHGSYLSAIIANADDLRILSRKGGTITVAWTRIVGIEGSSTRDFGVDYPCVTLTLRTDSGPVRLPLRATRSAWHSLFMTSPRLVGELVTEMSALRDSSSSQPRRATNRDGVA